MIEVKDDIAIFTLVTGEKIRIWLSPEGKLGIEGEFYLSISSERTSLLVVPFTNNNIRITTEKALALENKHIEAIIAEKVKL